MHTSLRRLPLLLLLLMLSTIVGGCVSTQDRFEKAQRLEREGRDADAAKYYLKVLQKEPDWTEARERLATVGAAVVATRLEDAHAAADAEQFETAVRALQDIDALRDDAARVGVPLAVPDDYDAFHAAMHDGAVATLLRQAERAEAAGRWDEALRRYTRVQERYHPEPEVLAHVTEARARVHLRWAEADLDHGHPRAAFDRAARTLDLMPPEAPLAAAAHRLRDDALAAGTRYVAFLPAAATDAARREAPSGFTERLDDVLRYEHWRTPPPFVAPIDPAEVFRALRRHRYGDRPDEHEAADLGRDLDADFVVLLDVTAFTDAERDVREERVAARTRGRNALDTTYVHRRAQRRLTVEAEYAVLDVVTRRVVDRGTVRADAEAPVAYGRYAGDWRDLDLSRRARALFDPDALDEDEAALVAALTESLADDLAEPVYRDLLRRIP